MLGRILGRWSRRMSLGGGRSRRGGGDMGGRRGWGMEMAMELEGGGWTWDEVLEFDSSSWSGRG